MNGGGGEMSGGGGGMIGDMDVTHCNFSTPWSNPQFACNMMQRMTKAMMGGMSGMGEQHGQHNQHPDYFGSAHASFSNRQTSVSCISTPPQKKLSIEVDDSWVKVIDGDFDGSDMSSN